MLRCLLKIVKIFLTIYESVESFHQVAPLDMEKGAPTNLWETPFGWSFLFDWPDWLSSYLPNNIIIAHAAA